MKTENICIKQTVEGVEYTSIREVAEAYSLTRSCIYKRYQRGLRGDELIPAKHRRDYVPAVQTPKIRLTVNEKDFSSISQACRYFGVDRNCYTARKRIGWTDEEAFGIVPHVDQRTVERKRKSRVNRGSKNISAFGRDFKSLSELAGEVNIPYYVLYQRIRRYGKTIEEAILMEGKEKPIRVGSETFGSIKDFAETCGIEPTRMSSLLKKYSPEEILKGENGSLHAVAYKGQIFPSLKALAEANGISYHKLQYRLSCDLTLEEALAIPVDASVVASMYGDAATIYLVELTDEDIGTGSSFYKLGVTQRPLEKRMAEFRLPTRVVWKQFGGLAQLLDIEKAVNRELAAYRATRFTAKDFDGFSEVFQLNEDELNKMRLRLKQLLNSQKSRRGHPLPQKTAFSLTPKPIFPQA